MTNVLEVHNLCKEYGTFSLKDVSFKIPQGYIMGFIGPNGAGKTTTIKSILNMIGYESGEIKLFGKNSMKGAISQNDKIGIVMDSPFYVDEWKVGNVEQAVAPFYRQWDGEQYAKLLKRFSIDEKKCIKELSRGMKIKLMMAVALSHNAKLLILDEPTSGLDPVARDELCDMLSDFITDESRSVLFSTHITSDLERVADHITFILDGRIVYTGAKEALLEKYALVKGGLQELNPDQKKLLIGLREHGTGFDGMAQTANIGKLPKHLLVEPISLDEIIVYMNKGGKLHE